MDLTMLALSFGIFFDKLHAYHLGDNLMHFEEKPLPVPNPYENNNSEVVGSAMRHLNLHHLKRRAKLRAIKMQAKLLSHHILPGLLLSSTPEEFVNDEVIYFQEPNVVAAHYESKLHEGRPYDEHPLYFDLPWKSPRNTPNWSEDEDSIGPFLSDSRSAEPDPTIKHFHKNYHVPLFMDHHHGHSSFAYPPNAYHDFFTHSHGEGLHNPSFQPQFTTNKQNTFIVLPAPNNNFQISQVAGNHNAASQLKTASSSVNNPQTFQQDWQENHNLKRHKRHLSSYFQTFYTPTRTQRSCDPVVRAPPNLVKVDKSRKIWHISEPQRAEGSGSVKVVQSAPKRQKRFIRLLRLLLDPNAQVDVPKTFEKMGSIARHSTESRHTPIYHVTNALGAARDAFMSTLRIPPQNLFVPSTYAIVDKKHKNVRSLNENEVYSKIGGMIRDSVQSGQDVITHAGELLHSTRKAVTTSRNVLPRMVISSLRVPIFQHMSLLPTTVHTSSRLAVPDSETDPNFVSVSHVMDVLGIGEKQQEDDLDSCAFSLSKQGKVLDSLDRARKAVGARSLREFIEYMKQSKLHNGFRKRAFNTTQNLLKNSTEEKQKFLFDLFQTSDLNKHNFWDREKTPRNDIKIQNKRQVHEAFLGAINPEMFRKLFNESLDLEHHHYLRPFGQKEYGFENENPRLGIGMHLGGKLVAPFMGKLERQEVYGYPYDYYEDEYDDEYEYW